MTHPIFHRISPSTVILQQRHEVLFYDGTAIGLHQVEQHGLVSHYLRCLVSEGLHAIMFDLRDLASELGAGLPRCLARDVESLVAITLRQKYSTASELAAAVFGVSRLAVLLPEPDGKHAQQARLFNPASPAPALAWPRRTGAREWA